MKGTTPLYGLLGTREGYDRYAPLFDGSPFRTPDAVLDQVARYIGARPVGRALDVCCGTGAGVVMLRPLVTEEVVGLDYSEGMLEVARRNAQQALGTAPVRLIHGDALGMTFDAEFDVVTSFGAFGHFEDWQQPALLRRIHRALKPGGRFVFVTTTQPTALEQRWWIYKGFHAAMAVRNTVIKPEFVMIYLNFTVPEILPLLDRVGFDTVLYDCEWERRPYKIAVATRR